MLRAAAEPFGISMGTVPRRHPSEAPAFEHIILAQQRIKAPHTASSHYRQAVTLNFRGTSVRPRLSGGHHGSLLHTVQTLRFDPPKRQGGVQSHRRGNRNGQSTPLQMIPSNVPDTRCPRQQLLPS